MKDDEQNSILDQDAESYIEDFKKYKAIDRESFILLFALFFSMFHLIELVLGVTIDKVVYDMDDITIIIETAYETILIGTREKTYY